MENKKWYDNMHMLNRDPDWDTHWLWEDAGRDDSSAEACKKGIEEIFGEYRNPLTDVALCLFCQVALLPSKSYFWGGRFWPLYKTNHLENVTRWERPYRIYEEHKLDPVQIFIDQTRKNNIRPWASFRMNDCHPMSMSTAMFAEAVEQGQTVGDEYGYFHHCFDFTYPKYKNALRDLIKEVFEKYDFFGLELDFMREPYCFNFRHHPGCHEIMTEYIREIKAIIVEAEKRVGHDIKILIRVPARPATALAFGFDVKTMVEEGLIDAVNPTPRWRVSDSGIPVGEWKELVGDRIPVIPGIEQRSTRDTLNDIDMAKGYFASFFGQGGDGTYLYNLFGCSEKPSFWDITRENCHEGRRSFVVTEEDCIAYYETRYKPLPIDIDGESGLGIEVGLIKPTDDVRVVIDFEGEKMPTLSLFGKEYAAAKTEPIFRGIHGSSEMANLTDHTPLEFNVSGIETASHLDLTFVGNGTVHYVEVMIDAK